MTERPSRVGDSSVRGDSSAEHQYMGLNDAQLESIRIALVRHAREAHSTQVSVNRTGDPNADLSC